MYSEPIKENSATTDTELTFRAQRVFDEALKRACQDRRAFVQEICKGDSALAARALLLLAEFERTSDEINPHPATELHRSPPLHNVEFTGTSRFVIQRQLGVGAFGTVFQVWDREHRLSVALKVLNSWEPNSLLRFKREFRSLEKVRHPNLVRLYELFSEGDLWFFTMELLEGPNLRDFLRPRVNACQWNQVRNSIGELFAGVQCLHDFNCVHRDLKPGNILTNSKGSVVILDFGLIREVDTQLSVSMSMAGTLAYMSPEQLLGRRVSSKSDWFSAGIIVFEALSGRLPFERSSLELQSTFETSIDSLLHTLNPEVPEDLRALCADLLRVSPESRIEPPRSIYSQIQNAGSTERASYMPAREIFVGRDEAFGLLEAAYANMREGKLNVFLLEGISGIGKSTLLQQFKSRLHGRYSDLVFLSGKCYEFESVPYKGVDPLIDNLTTFLNQLSDIEIQSILPRDASLLPKLFPVFGTIKAIARARVFSDIPDDQELRQRAFNALREMIARVADRRPVVLWIDNFQWADRDSSIFLADLCSPPNQPSLLLILSYRSEDASTNPTLQYLGSVLTSNNRLMGNWHHLVLQGLASEDVKELAAHLLGDAATETTIDTIVREAAGNPLFVRELARSTADPIGHELVASGADLSLKTVLQSRIESLSPIARTLLETLCIATKPMQQSIILATAESGEDEDVLSELMTLVRENFARVSRSGTERRFELFHDQVRSAVFESMTDEMRRLRHSQLASVLITQASAEPQLLVAHYRESGDLESACRAALAAAKAAEEQLAFERAAEFYGFVVEAQTQGNPTTMESCRKLAECLGKAGRGRDSAKSYLRAAEHTEPSLSFSLRMLAADQFLRSGYLDEGLALFSQLVEQVGLRTIRTPAEAFARMVRHRLRTHIRMRLFKPTPTTKPLSDSYLAKVELLRIGGVVLNIVDPVKAAYFQTRYVSEVIGRGDADHLAIALGIEASIRAATGVRDPQDCFSLLERALSISTESENPNVQGFVYLCRAYVDYLLMQIPDGIRDSRVAIDFLRSHCTGVAWEITASHVLSFWFKCWGGEVAEVRDLLPQLLKESAARGDANVEVSLRLLSYVHFVYLAADEPDQCLSECQNAINRWPDKPFTLQHYGAMFIQVETYFYKEDYVRARDSCLSWWARMRGSFIVRWRVLAVMAAFLRGRAALACWLGDRSDIRMRREVEQYSQRLKRIGSPWCTPMAAVLDAGLACGIGSREDALSFLNIAQKEFEELDLHAFSSAAAFRAGAIRGGIDGEWSMRAAKEFMSAQKVRVPDAFLRLLIPGDWTCKQSVQPPGRLTSMFS